MKKSRAVALRIEGWKKVRQGLNQESTKELYKAVDEIIKENDSKKQISQVL